MYRSMELTLMVGEPHICHRVAGELRVDAFGGSVELHGSPYLLRERKVGERVIK